MIFRRFRRDPQSTIAALYGAIVAQARRPVFYLAYEVPDTAEGRLDMVLLHLALVCRRLGAGGPEAQALSQDVFDMFCSDMDGNLREMGVSDLAVPRKMQKMGEAFYGRLDAYDRALAAPDDAALAAALARNVLDGVAAGEPARRLAHYVRGAAAALDATPLGTLAAGQVRFPDPDAIASPAREVQR